MSLGGLKKALGRKVALDAAKFIAAPDDVSLSGSVLAKATRVAQDLNALAQDLPLTADLAPIDNREENPHDEQLRLSFALAERLSLDYAYRDVDKQPLVIRLLEEDDVVRQYRIIKLQSGHGGIAGNILIPHGKTDTQRIYVNFRGTQPHILSSVHLNFEHCAGEESFYTHFEEIMGQINSLIATVSDGKKPVKLVFAGHSLGGALSQHAHMAAMSLAAVALRSDLKREGVDQSTQDRITQTQQTFRDYLAAKYKLALNDNRFEHFDKVESFALNSWGMAGVSKAIECCSNEYADVLHENAKKVFARYGINTFDIVPRCGEANTLSNCKGDVACVVISDTNLNVARNVAAGCIDGVVTGTLFGGAYGAAAGLTTALVRGLSPINDAHNTFQYGAYGELLADKEYKMHENGTLAGKNAIIAAFDNKLTVLQKPLLVKAKSMLQQAGNMGASLKEAATLQAVKTLKTIYSLAPTKTKPTK